MLDAYTVRKAIPRILLAVIGINISIYLCVAAIEVTNIIGHGLGQLITQPFLEPESFKSVGIANTASNNSFVAGGAIITSLIGGGIIWAGIATGVGVGAAAGAVAASAGLALLGVLVPFLISVALITLAILFTLIIRQGLLIFLTIISPVAIALFVLPGTEKYFKQWFDLFVKTLLVYPIIASIFALSTAMGAILLGTAGDSPGGIGLAKVLGTIIVVFAPLVLIPFAFKLAGGAIAAVANAGSARAGSISQRAGKKFHDFRNDPNSMLGKAQNKALRTRGQAGLTGGQIASGVYGGIRRKDGQSFRKAYGLASGAGFSETAQEELQNLDKLRSMQPIKGNDDAMLVASSFKDANGVWRTRTYDEKLKFLEDRGIERDSAEKIIAQTDRALATTSQQQFDRFAAVNLPATGTAFKKGGFAEMSEFIAFSSGGDRALEGNMMAMARSKAGEGRRGDLVAGFGTSMNLQQVMRDYQEGKLGQNYINSIDTSTRAGAQEKARLVETSKNFSEHLAYGGKDIDSYVNEVATDNVLFTQSAGQVISQRGDSIKLMIPAFNRRIDRAVQAVDTAHALPGNDPNRQQNIDQAERSLRQELAATAASHDVIAQVSPENAKVFADGVLGRSIDLTKLGGARDQLSLDPASGIRLTTPQMTILQAIDLKRSDAQFQETRRELGNSTMAQYSQAMQASAAAVQGNIGQTPTGPASL